MWWEEEIVAPHSTAVFGIVCKLHISSQFEYTTLLLHRGENMPREGGEMPIARSPLNMKLLLIITDFLLFSPDGQPTLLPPDHVQELNLRSTGMLNAIQRFFAYHMIETYGCDYSTSGLSFDTLHSKIKSFLELRTADGPRHDTYILYYSGHSHGTGEWALAGNCFVIFFSSSFGIDKHSKLLNSFL